MGGPFCPEGTSWLKYGRGESFEHPMHFVSYLLAFADFLLCGKILYLYIFERVVLAQTQHNTTHDTHLQCDDWCFKVSPWELDMMSTTCAIVKGVALFFRYSQGR